MTGKERTKLRRRLRTWRCKGQAVLPVQTFEDVCPPPCARCHLLPHRCECKGDTDA